MESVAESPYFVGTTPTQHPVGTISREDYACARRGRAATVLKGTARANAEHGALDRVSPPEVHAFAILCPIIERPGLIMKITKITTPAMNLPMKLAATVLTWAALL